MSKPTISAKEIANPPKAKTVSISFKYDAGKKVGCKEIVLPVVREYLGGAVQVASGDVYQTIKGTTTTHLATK